MKSHHITQKKIVTIGNDRSVVGRLVMMCEWGIQNDNDAADDEEQQNKTEDTKSHRIPQKKIVIDDDDWSSVGWLEHDVWMRCTRVILIRLASNHILT